MSEFQCKLLYRLIRTIWTQKEISRCRNFNVAYIHWILILYLFWMLSRFQKQNEYRSNAVQINGTILLEYLYFLLLYLGRLQKQATYLNQIVFEPSKILNAYILCKKTFSFSNFTFKFIFCWETLYGVSDVPKVRICK